jgi:hypothetical protein
MFNAVLKIPMQFFILFTGVMVFLFYQFVEPPILFKPPALRAVMQSPHAPEMKELEARYSAAFEEKRAAVVTLASVLEGDDESAIAAAQARVKELAARSEAIRTKAKELVTKVDPKMEVKDSDYVFLRFIADHLPRGVVGLLIAVIFCAGMSSTSSELNALGSTSTVDLYKRLVRPRESERHYVIVSRLLTAVWGLVAIGSAIMAFLVENLIEAVNILGSLFYGTILGIFLTAFLLKRVKGTAVFTAAIVAECIVIGLYLKTDIGYLWYNLVGCVLVLALALIIQAVLPQRGAENVASRSRPTSF